MIAKDYIAKYVTPSAQPFATVVISAGKKFTHMPLGPNQEVREENEREGINVFIHINEADMPPVLIADRNCKAGYVCEDHPLEPVNHAGCYGQSRPCPYPRCTEDPQSEAEELATVVNLGAPDNIGENIGL